MSYRHLTALIVVALATSAPAQKGGKPKPGASLNPEIAYTYASGNYMDLRLANEDATGAVTLHRSGYGAISQFDLGPRAQRQIALIDDRDLKLLTYEPTGSGSVQTVGVETIYAGPGDVTSLSFSPDGSTVAFFAVSDGTGGIIRYYDVATGTISDGATIGFAFYMAWYHDGSGLVYANCDDQCSSYSVHEALLDGSTRVLLTEANIEHVDTARTSKDLLISYSRPGLNEIRVGLWRNGSYSNERVVAGLLAHFNCDDSRFIYRGYARMKRPTYKYSFASNTSSTFSTDSDIHHTDWMPTC